MNRLPDVVEAKVERTDYCWNWVGRKNHQGYGCINIAYKFHFAHRLVYSLLVSPILEGLTIDHLCRNKSCVNPDHLEAVPMSVNTKRWAFTKTHCKRGHPLEGANLLIQRNGTKRVCRTCQSYHIKSWKIANHDYYLQKRRELRFKKTVACLLSDAC